MSDAWHKTTSDEEAEARLVDLWSRHAAELRAGKFWADRLKELKGEPVERLKLALENLPLPASFREAAVATRALIREKRKAGEKYGEELALLYWLAAINSFSIPYSTVLREPGYNVIESIPADRLMNVPFTYTELGFEKLELLNKTDIKWLTEAWGVPSRHTTLHDMHMDMWREYEAKLKKKRDEERADDHANFTKELESLRDAQTSHKSYKWLLWFGVGVGIIILLLSRT
jgi:hypothetical protein